MSFNELVKLAAMLFCLLILAGCKPEGSAPAAQEEVKTAAEYKAEAEREITEENMDAELASLEQAVDAEASQTP